MFSCFKSPKQKNNEKETLINNEKETLINNNEKSRLLVDVCKKNNQDNKFDMVKDLLQNGADPNFKDEIGCTAIMYAARYSKKGCNNNIIKILLKYGARINETNSNHINKTALIYAVAYSSDTSSNETVEFLIKNGADINFTDEYGQTPLMYASAWSKTTSSVETVKILIENGAAINVLTKEKDSALMMACSLSNTSSNTDTIKLLMRSGANINMDILTRTARNVDDKSSIAAIKILLEYGTNTNIITDNNQTFLHLLPAKYHKECLEIIYKNKHYKYCMEYIHKQILRNAYKFLLQPGSIRTQLLAIRFDPNKYTYEYIKINNPVLLDYFGIMDENTFKIKISHYMNYND